jgi:hypothetical protein
MFLYHIGRRNVDIENIHAGLNDLKLLVAISLTPLSGTVATCMCGLALESAVCTSPAFCLDIMLLE